MDSIYEIAGKKVYALAKNKTEEVNLFYLKVVLTFLDGSTSEANTKNFRIVGKAKDNVPKAKADNALPEGRWKCSLIDYLSILKQDGKCFRQNCGL